jgi:hypothetical protein
MHGIEGAHLGAICTLPICSPPFFEIVYGDIKAVLWPRRLSLSLGLAV